MTIIRVDSSLFCHHKSCKIIKEEKIRVQKINSRWLKIKERNYKKIEIEKNRWLDRRKCSRNDKEVGKSATFQWSKFAVCLNISTPGIKKTRLKKIKTCILDYLFMRIGSENFLLFLLFSKSSVARGKGECATHGDCSYGQRF